MLKKSRFKIKDLLGTKGRKKYVYILGIVVLTAACSPILFWTSALKWELCVVTAWTSIYVSNRVLMGSIFKPSQTLQVPWAARFLLVVHTGQDSSETEVTRAKMKPRKGFYTHFSASYFSIGSLPVEDKHIGIEKQKSIWWERLLEHHLCILSFTIKEPLASPELMPGVNHTGSVSWSWVASTRLFSPSEQTSVAAGWPPEV